MPLHALPLEHAHSQQQQQQQEEHEQQQEHAQAATAAAKAPRPPPADPPLATPQLNSSRLLLQRRQQLLEELECTAPPALGEAEEQAARQRAATAATIVPQGTALYPGLPPAQTHSAASPSSKAAALARATKSVDQRWERQQAEPLPPPVWRAELQLKRLLGAAPSPLPRTAVPLPDARAVAASLLGLRLQ